MLTLSLLDDILIAMDLDNSGYIKISNWEKHDGYNYSTEYVDEEKRFFTFISDNTLVYIIPPGTFDVVVDNKEFKMTFDGKDIKSLDGNVIEWKESSILN